MCFTSHGEVALCNLQTASLALFEAGVRIRTGDEAGFVMIRFKETIEKICSNVVSCISKGKG